MPSSLVFCILKTAFNLEITNTVKVKKDKLLVEFSNGKNAVIEVQEIK